MTEIKIIIAISFNYICEFFVTQEILLPNENEIIFSTIIVPVQNKPIPSILHDSSKTTPLQQRVPTQTSFISKYTPEAFAKLQSKCKELGPLITYLKTSALPTNKQRERERENFIYQKTFTNRNTT